MNETEYSVTNSKPFPGFIINQKVAGDELVVSFDVSLHYFTSVQVDMALVIFQRKLGKLATGKFKHI